jgi:hypothetical protein
MALLGVGLLVWMPAAAQSPFFQGPWKWPTRAFGLCEYHPIPSDSRALVTTLPQRSNDLKSDGLGAYWQGNDTVRSYLGSRGVV